MKNIILFSALSLIFSAVDGMAQLNSKNNDSNTKTKVMEAQDYTTTITVAQSPAQVFDAINNVRGWWSEQIEGRTDALNEVFDYHYQDVHRSRMKIIEFVPNKKVVWLVEDNYFNFIKDQSEWKGTKISFEISKKGNLSQLVFTHIGLVPAYECYNICTDAWSNYIKGSLKNLIENGKGNPNPYQTAIDSAVVKKNATANLEANYTASFLIDKSPATVFNAIADVNAWWSEDFKGSSQALGDEFSVTFGDVHYSKHKVLDFLPFKRIVWLVTDSKLSFLKNQKEWTGTKNIFEISTEGGKTRLTFTHVGLTPNIACYGDCSKGWNYYLQESLLPFILTGKGKPNEL